MRLFYYRVVALILSLHGSPAYAQSIINDNICNFTSGVFDASCIPLFIAGVIGELFKLTGALSLLMIMVGGFEYSLDKLAGGKERGTKRIQNGIIGMVVSAFAFFIVSFIISAIK